MKKLKDLLSEVFAEQPQVDKYQVGEAVSNYGLVGKQLYNSVNIMEVAEQLVVMAEAAKSHVLGEQDDWFDKVTVNKNMKNLGGMVKEFKQTANESHVVNQRLQAIYEDMGHILNRYYDIREEDKGDMDSDGKNEPDDEEYLQQKRAAVSKAVKGEARRPQRSRGVGGVVSVGAVGNLRRR